jgi:hypothetical protein
MTSITEERSANKLVLRQHKKLTLTGFVFCVPGVMIWLYAPKTPGIFLLLSCLLLLLVAVRCFYKGITYTCTADRTNKTLELEVKGLFSSSRQTWHFRDIRFLLLGEKDLFLQSSTKCTFDILLDTRSGRRFRLLNFRSRPSCKDTIALIENYLTATSAPLRVKEVA